MADLDYDVRRGHAYVRADNGRLIAQLCDMGGACAVIAEGDMTPEEATKLGHALISWSAWRRRVIPSVDHYQRTAEPTMSAAAVCEHEWSDRGSPGDHWQECWLCGNTRDVVTPPASTTTASEDR